MAKSVDTMCIHFVDYVGTAWVYVFICTQKFCANQLLVLFSHNPWKNSLFCTSPFTQASATVFSHLYSLCTGPTITTTYINKN